MSYEELAFHLLDSASFQAFARLPDRIPSKAALQADIAAITDLESSATRLSRSGAELTAL